MTQFRAAWGGLRIGGHGVLDGGGHVVGNVEFAQVRNGLRGDAHELRDDLLAGATFEGRVAGEGAEHGRTEPVDVRGGGWRAGRRPRAR